MDRAIGFLNEKGGSCKTTLSVHLAAHLATEHHRTVLLLDLDPQGQAGKCFGVDVAAAFPNVLDLLVDPDTPLSECVYRTGVEGVFLVPSNKTLVNFPLQVGEAPDRYLRLARKVRFHSDRDFDVVICDAPPSMGILSLNILMAVEAVVIPVNCTYLALDGCAEVVDSVERVRAELGHDRLEVRAVVPTLYRRTRLADEIVSGLRARFGDRLTSVLRYDVKVDEAQSHGRTVFDYARGSRGASMLRTICEEIWNRVQ